MGEDVSIDSGNWTGRFPPTSASYRVGLATVLGVSAIYAAMNIICVCLVAMCLMWAALKYLGSREERDKIAEIVARRFWREEDQIACLFKVLAGMKEATVFRDVTAYHVLSYKYRTDNGVYSIDQLAGGRDGDDCDDDDDDGGGGGGGGRGRRVTRGRGLNVFRVLKKIERLFVSLTLQLPQSGRCSRQASSTVGSPLLSIAQVTLLVWCDEKAEAVLRVVRFFSGPRAAADLARSRVRDGELESLVLSRMPYVMSLSLGPDFSFVLRDPSSDGPARGGDPAVRALLEKICRIDRFFSENRPALESAKERIAALYQEARELSFKNKLIFSRAHFPDLSAVRNGGPAGRFQECTACLVHLLRLMSYGSNVKKMESDESFPAFLDGLTGLVESLSLGSADDASTIERTRRNIVSCLDGLSSEHVLADREFTKAKLELIEKDLRSHVRYLASRRAGLLRKDDTAETSLSLEVGRGPAPREGPDEPQPGPSGVRKGESFLPLLPVKEGRSETSVVIDVAYDDSDEDPYCETNV